MENQKGSVRGKALSLSDMASAFVILGLGTSLAFLVFLVERIIHLAQSHRHSDAAKIVIVVAPSVAPDVAASIIQPIANNVNAAVIASDIASPQPELLLRPAPPARIVRKPQLRLGKIRQTNK